MHFDLSKSGASNNKIVSPGIVHPNGMKRLSLLLVTPVQKICCLKILLHSLETYRSYSLKHSNCGMHSTGGTWSTHWWYTRWHWRETVITTSYCGNVIFSFTSTTTADLSLVDGSLCGVVHRWYSVQKLVFTITWKLIQIAFYFHIHHGSNHCIFIYFLPLAINR